MRKDRTSEPSTQAVAVQVPLPLVEALQSAEEAFFELCVRAGQEVLGAMMEQDRTARCGPKWSRQPDRTARRSGTTRSEVTLGGRRVGLRRPRARTSDGKEIALPTFDWATDRDPLDRRTMEAVAAGVSTRAYRQQLDPLPAETRERAVSRSAVSRRFVARSAAKLAEWIERPLDDLELLAVTIDGLVIKRRCVLIALGIDAAGRKHVLGLHDGTTENLVVVRTLLEGLVTRGLSADQPPLFVIDGSRALSRAIQALWGPAALIQRCQVHKRRNVAAHLPERERGRVVAAMKQAHDLPDAKRAKERLRRLARSLEADHPGAAGSLREGLDETLTVQRLGLRGALARTLRSTNVIENLNSSVARYTRNVKRWRNGKMIVRWVAAALWEAHQRFRRVRGFSELPKLQAALARHRRSLDTEGQRAA